MRLGRKRNPTDRKQQHCSLPIAEVSLHEGATITAPSSPARVPTTILSKAHFTSKARGWRGTVRYGTVQCGAVRYDADAIRRDSSNHVGTGTSDPVQSLVELILIHITARRRFVEDSKHVYSVSAQVVLGAGNALVRTGWLTETDMFAKTLVSSCCNHPVVAPAEEVCSSPGLSRRKKGVSYEPIMQASCKQHLKFACSRALHLLHALHCLRGQGDLGHDCTLFGLEV